MRSAKLRSVYDQVSSFKVAVQSFSEKYGAMPGDLKDAVDLLQADSNGRGDGRFESLEDAKRFWNHLHKSGIISNELLDGMPKSKVGGYFTVSSNVNGRSGVWIVLTLNTNDNVSFNGILTPEDAYFIDRNSDNGNPNSGDIQAIKASNAKGEIAVGDKYNLKNKSEDCVMLFKIW